LCCRPNTCCLPPLPFLAFYFSGSKSSKPQVEVTSSAPSQSCNTQPKADIPVPAPSSPDRQTTLKRANECEPEILNPPQAHSPKKSAVSTASDTTPKQPHNIPSSPAQNTTTPHNIQSPPHTPQPQSKASAPVYSSPTIPMLPHYPAPLIPAPSPSSHFQQMQLNSSPSRDQPSKAEQHLGVHPKKISLLILTYPTISLIA
jgi:hypothetical protein